MIVTTTPTLQNETITHYLGIVCGEAIYGANVGRDFMAGITNFFGGRSNEYEEELQRARNTAIAEMEQRAVALGANAIVGVDLDYEVLGQGASMLMVTASGTAVVVA